MSHILPMAETGHARRVVERIALLADSVSPLQLYHSLEAQGLQPALFESNEGGDRWGRYTLLLAAPMRRLLHRAGGHTELVDGTERINLGPVDPLIILQGLLRQTTLENDNSHDGYEGPTGGFYGLLGYPIMHWIEPRVPVRLSEREPLPVVELIEPGLLFTFDHVRQLLWIQRFAPPGQAQEPLERYGAALIEAARCSPGPAPRSATARQRITLQHQTPAEVYLAAVEKAKQHIHAGDIFQIVLAQRFTAPATTSAYELYRALRIVNPSPYLFLLPLSGGTLVGSSPEVMVRLRRRRIELRPIAGTRPRGATRELDQAHERELRADPKELAEHLMLVDLGRNDVGRVAVAGSVEVPEKFVVERYSRVMHIVSQVEGTLRDDCDGVDLFRATFPAGTVSGAPKVRACELIYELEGLARGPYAGAVGYFDYRGDMDTCIVLRTAIHDGTHVHLTAGAGVVYDSVAAHEHTECINKARALVDALEMLAAPAAGAK